MHKCDNETKEMCAKCTGLKKASSVFILFRYQFRELWFKCLESSATPDSLENSIDEEILKHDTNCYVSQMYLLMPYPSM